MVVNEAADPVEEAAGTIDEERIPVTRDPGFVRVMADECAASNRGAYTELSFIAAGPSVVFRTRVIRDREVSDSYRMEPSLTETALVRLPTIAAGNLAMSIIRKLIQADLVNAELLIASIRDWSDVQAAERAAGAQEEGA